MHVLHSTMAPLLISFFLSLFLILSTHILQQTCFASEDTAEQDIPNCPSSFSYHCGNLSYSTLSYPFTDAPFPTKCSPYALHCNKNNDTIVSMFGIPNTTAQYQLLDIKNHAIYLYRTNVGNQQKNQDDCDFNRYTPFLKYPSFDPWSLFSKSFKILNDEAYLRCPNGSLPTDDKKHWNCTKDTVISGPYTLDDLRARQMVVSSCYILPKINTTLSIWYDVDYQCTDCTHQGGTCYNSPGSWTSMCLKKKEEEKSLVKKKRIIILASVSGVAIVTLLVIILIVFWHRRKMKYTSRNKPRYLGFPKSKDFEQGSVLFGVPVFSYDDLKDATENFNSTKELGEGGFGTVYHGILKDGREVAVKRLHEKTYKQIEQFLNELRILTCLHHKNLVTLYGCTSRHCRELLLVYEYVPNGTLADHLHGDKAASRSLTWPIRMAIAIETASALVYLHATDIIHRDVKTNNILLDKDFIVKVADFGLSRLFPIDVTHVSTAPQGTPGYVDPEYHHCYQLTDKSDVFSFGVVLVELISSLRAVDVNRYKHEINLSTYAMNRIQCGAFNELIDPNLGFDSDFKVERMTTLVSELAFQCLQQKSELRPSMEEVFEALKNIESADYNMLEAEVMGMKAEIGKASSRSSKPPSTPSEKDESEIFLRGVQLPTSPKSVMNKWMSKSEIFLRGVQLPTSPKSVMNKWMSKSVTPKTSCSDL